MYSKPYRGRRDSRNAAVVHGRDGSREQWPILCHGRDRRGSRSIDIDLSGYLIGSNLLGAVAGDMTSLAALVAAFTRGVQGTAVRGGAVSGNVAKLATSVALHSLGLAVTSEVVRAATLVAGGGPGTTGIAATGRESSVTPTGDGWSATTHCDRGGVRASSGQVAGLAAIIAAAVGPSAA